MLDIRSISLPVHTTRINTYNGLHKATGSRIEDRSASHASTLTTGYAGHGGRIRGGSVMAKNFVGGVMII